MTHLDSILKSRDITLPTKVRLVKAMVFEMCITISLVKTHQLIWTQNQRHEERFFPVMRTQDLLSLTIS